MIDTSGPVTRKFRQLSNYIFSFLSTSSYKFPLGLKLRDGDFVFEQGIKFLIFKGGKKEELEGWVIFLIEVHTREDNLWKWLWKILQRDFLKVFFYNCHQDIE